MKAKLGTVRLPNGMNILLRGDLRWHAEDKSVQRDAEAVVSAEDLREGSGHPVAYMLRTLSSRWGGDFDMVLND